MLCANDRAAYWLAAMQDGANMGPQDGKRCLQPRLTLFNKLMTKSCPPLQRVEAVILNDKLILAIC
jgi:hypothetical protein